MQSGLCNPVDAYHFYVAYVLNGFVFVGFLYFIHLIVDRFFGWRKVPCKYNNKYYLYTFKGKIFKSKNISMSTEFPLSVNEDVPKNINFCYIKESNPKRSRLFNIFTNKTPFSSLLSIPLSISIYYFTPNCFKKEIYNIFMFTFAGAFLCIAIVLVTYFASLAKEQKW